VIDGKGPRPSVIQEIPRIGFANLNDPDQMIVWGATLDGAERTKRLPEEERTVVTSVAPYSVGIGLTGDIVTHLIQRGEPLPAYGKTSLCTTLDNQTEISVPVLQGEHLLADMNNGRGIVELAGLPSLPRRMVDAVCTIEYSDDGILLVSATAGGQSVHATLRAKSEFTPEECAQLELGSRMNMEDEKATAERHFQRVDILLDIERAEAQLENDRYQDSARKWREWLWSYENDDPRLFIAARNESQREFYAIDPLFWRETAFCSPDIGLRKIWPLGPSFTQEGAAIVRFLTDQEYSRVSLSIENIATGEVTWETEIGQLVVGNQIETVVRIAFPADGKYKVRVAVDESGDHLWARELGHRSTFWRFDVAGTPAPRRDVRQLISGSSFVPIVCDRLRISPESSCVWIPETVYEFLCTFQGKKLAILGREPNGEPEQSLVVRTTAMPSMGDWKSRKCRLEVPSPGMWRVLFWVDGVFVATQFVVAGDTGALQLTPEERIAFAAPIP
jgi:hypothetical protein